MLAVERGDDFRRDGFQDGALLRGLIARRFQAEFQLLQPVPHAGKIGFDIGDQHFELV